jgi:hypothetical protein
MARQALVLVAVVLIFGVLLPWYKGMTMLQPLVVVAYALMGLLFVAPAASEFWSSLEIPASPGSVMARLLAIVGYGWGIALAMLIASMVTLNVAYRSPRLLIPPEPFLASALVLSLTAAAAVAVICALLARRFSASMAKATVRTVFLVVLLVLAFGARVMPESWQIELADHTTRRAITSLAWEGSIACAVISILGIVLLLRVSPASSEAPAS